MINTRVRTSIYQVQKTSEKCIQHVHQLEMIPHYICQNLPVVGGADLHLLEVLDHPHSELAAAVVHWRVLGLFAGQ